ncbi:MAG: LPP20 family lipoprotein, partial [Candidatus Cloacimonetes bacterium]|nr:LPP20 family lipoprotein [Candidatus Cloacimonadota bacterium]
MNKIFILLFSLFISVNIFSLTISEIRNDNNYLCGYGEDESYESANKKALQDLVSQISVQVEANFTDMYEEKDGTLTEFTQSVVNTYSNTTLKNVQSKVDEKSNSGKVIVLRYIPKENITDIFAARKRKIIDYTKTAIKAEQELRIGDALKNYYWALLLLRSHPDNNKIKCNFEDKREFTLITALPDRIERILSFIKFSISGNYYDPEDKKRTIKLDIQIQDQDVQNLDYSFYTGDNWSKNITVKEGIGIAEFYDGNAVFVNELNLKIEYEYFNRIFDNEVREVKDDLTQPEFSSSRLKILLTEKFQESNISNKLQVEIAPVNEDINRIFYEEKIKDILIAIDQKEFAGIKQHFTPKGFETFLKIIHYGNAALTSENFPLSTTKVNKSVIVRSIPMLFSFPQNDRQFVEKLSFIFNEEQKIESINFTLSEKAINDILEKSKKWGTISNKYQIIQFLEYYKTSYCLKDLDFV